MNLSTVAGHLSRERARSYVNVTFVLMMLMMLLLSTWARAGINGQVCPYISVITVAPSTSATNYADITPAGTQNNWSATESQIYYVYGGSGNATFSNLHVTVQNAPGAGKSWTFTIRINHAGGGSADTSVIATIADTSTTGNSGTATATFQPGDLVSIKSVPAGTPAAPGSLSFGSTMLDAGWSQHLFTANSINPTVQVAAGATTYMAPNYSSSNATESTFSEPFATPGTISSMYVWVDADPGGAAQSVAVTFRKGGVDQAVTATVSTGSQAANDTTHSFAVARTDIIGIRIVTSGSCASERVKVGYVFTPTKHGESVFCGEFSDVTASDKYTWGHLTPALLASEGTIQAVAPCAFQAYGWYFLAESPPSGQTSELRFRVSASDTALRATVTGTGTTAGDTSDIVNVSENNMLSIHEILSATAGTVKHRYSFVLYVPPIVQRRGPQSPRIGSRGGIARAVISPAILDYINREESKLCAR